MIKLSIIIPIFNVERYIERCIKSVAAHQDIDVDLYEIILINDGSTDNSLEIAKQVAENYNNISIITQKNTGLGGARNHGIKLAKGEYIWFIDSDDFIQKRSLNAILQKLSDEKLDVLAFDFSCTNEYGDIINWIDFKLNFNNRKLLNGPEFYELNYKESYIWLYIFKRSLFTNNHIAIKNRINMQDSELLPRIMFHVKTIAFLDKKIYYYVNREDSFINSNNIRTRLKYYKSIIKVSYFLKEFQETLSTNHIIIKSLSKKQKEIHKMLFQQYLYTNFDNERLKELLELLKTSNLFPFKNFEEKNKLKKAVYIFLRPMINLNPILFRNLYLKLRINTKKAN